MSDGMRILNEDDIKQSVKYLAELLDNEVSSRCVYIFCKGLAWADQTIAAELEKWRLPEPVGYSDKTGKHYFKDLALAKRLVPDEEFIPLYTHPPVVHILDVGQMVPEGWQLVPKEPTDEMLVYINGSSGFGRYASWHVFGCGLYRDMLAVAPKYKEGE